ncbi:MAG: YdcH family protein [Brevundimonas sp.]|uniref:YdcH family protein n=1 Tax=Brevundimonas sp. TaxID=1871086 RepID=UPI00391BCA73
MSIDARIRELGNRHRTLDEAIQKEMIRPSADALELKEMKRRKLRLKEQIEALQGQHH